MLFKKTLADTVDQGNNTYYELTVKKSKNVRKYPYKVHPKGAILLKISGSDFIQAAKIPKGEKITVLNAKLKNIGNISALQVSWKGKTGYVMLSRILAPSFIGKVKNLFTKPVKQPDDRVNVLNTNIIKFMQDMSIARSALPNSPPLPGLTIKIKGMGGAIKKLYPINFAYDTPLNKNSIAEFALGTSASNLQYWFAQIPDEESLSSFFSNKRSWVYLVPYLRNLLKIVYDNYVDNVKDGKILPNRILQTSVYHILDPSENGSRGFFQNATQGYHSHLRDGDVYNVGFFVGGDPVLTLDDAVKGKCTLKFKEGVMLSNDMISIFNQKKACIVVENVMGSQANLAGKIVRNASVGLYHTDYLRKLSDAVEI